MKEFREFTQSLKNYNKRVIKVERELAALQSDRRFLMADFAIFMETDAAKALMRGKLK